MRDCDGDGSTHVAGGRPTSDQLNGNHLCCYVHYIQIYSVLTQRSPAIDRAMAMCVVVALLLLFLLLLLLLCLHYIVSCWAPNLLLCLEGQRRRLLLLAAVSSSFIVYTVCSMGILLLQWIKCMRIEPLTFDDVCSMFVRSSLRTTHTFLWHDMNIATLLPFAAMFINTKCANYRCVQCLCFAQDGNNRYCR